MERSSEKTSELRSRVDCRSGRNGVKGQDERQRAGALDPRPDHHGIFRANSGLKALTDAEAVIHGLYLNPPTHAAVFCVDEKATIQALDRKDPVLPLSPGRAERHGFEYGTAPCPYTPRSTPKPVRC